jgi:hypothetical protein
MQGDGQRRMCQATVRGRRLPECAGRMAPECAGRMAPECAGRMAPECAGRMAPGLFAMVIGEEPSGPWLVESLNTWS